MRCADWPMEAVGAYLWVLDQAFQQGPLPRSAIDRKLAMLRDPESAPLIMERMIEVDGGWTHPRAHSERAHALGVSRVRASVGSLGGMKSRKASADKDLEAKQTGSNCLPIAKQLPSKPSLSLTSSSSDSSLPSKKHKDRKTVEGPRWDFAARDWVGITDEFVAGVAAKFPGLDIRAKIEDLADYCRMHPAKAARYKDFAAFIRSCCRKDHAASPLVRAGASRPAKETIEERSSRLRREADADLARIGWQPPVGAGAKGQSGPQTHTNNGTQQRAS